MKIIATTDFSETAQNAVQYALEMAKALDAELILYHAYSFPLHASNAHLSADAFQRLFETRFKRLCFEAANFEVKFGVKVVAESTFAFVEEGLAELIKKYDANLLVLGMADKSLEQDLMGNTTTSAIKNLNIPILSIPLHVKYEGLKKVLFACDQPDSVPDNVFAKIKETVLHLGGELEVFSVDNTIDELHAQETFPMSLNAQLEGINYYYRNVRSNSVIKEIAKEIDAFHADILVMLPKKYGFWESMVHRSKTRIMASGLNIPLLSIPLGS